MLDLKFLQSSHQISLSVLSLNQLDSRSEGIFQIWINLGRSHHLYWTLQLLISRSDDYSMHKESCSDLFYDEMFFKFMVLFRSVLNFSNLMYLLNCRSIILVHVYLPSGQQCISIVLDDFQ